MIELSLRRHEVPLVLGTPIQLGIVPISEMERILSDDRDHPIPHLQDKILKLIKLIDTRNAEKYEEHKIINDSTLLSYSIREFKENGYLNDG